MPAVIGLRSEFGAILGWAKVLGRVPGATPLITPGIEAIERNSRMQALARGVQIEARIADRNARVLGDESRLQPFGGYGAGRT